MLRMNFPKYCDYQNASFILLTTQFTLQQIMKDRWINAGHEDDELKPFVEPELDISDQKRIGNYSVPACWCVCQWHTFPFIYMCTPKTGMGFPDGSVGKEPACSAGDPGLIPESGRSPGEGNGKLLHYSCLEYPMDRGAWWATVHGITRVGHNPPKRW